MLQSEVSTHAAWRAEAVERFGSCPLSWRFACPSCGHAQSMLDFIALGVDPVLVSQNCIGRHLPPESPVGPLLSRPGPCRYTAVGGKFSINPRQVISPKSGLVVAMFDFAAH